MSTEFDIQRFAEEEEATNTDTVTDEEEVATEEESAETVSNEDKEPIPEEFTVLSEESARAAMKEWEDLNKGEEQPESESEPETPKAQEQPSEVDSLKAQLAAYQQRFGNLNQQQPSSQQQPRQPITPPPLNITPELAKEMDKYTTAEAMRMTGLTQDDLDGFEYITDEDHDEKYERFKAAKQMATSQMYLAINQAQMNYVARQQQIQRAHEEAVANYKAYEQKEMSEPDFKDVSAYATGDYFVKQPPALQQTVAEAWARVDAQRQQPEKQIATPADVALVQMYFNQAKADYHGQKGSGAKPKKPTKAQQAAELPKSDLITGTVDVGNSTNFSAAELERMLDNDVPLEKIPKKWREIMDRYV